VYDLHNLRLTNAKSTSLYRQSRSASSENANLKGMDLQPTPAENKTKQGVLINWKIADLGEAIEVDRIEVQNNQSGAMPIDRGYPPFRPPVRYS
jgi:hypothetical protein